MVVELEYFQIILLSLAAFAAAGVLPSAPVEIVSQNMESLDNGGYRFR